MGGAASGGAPGGGMGGAQAGTSNGGGAPMAGAGGTGSGTFSLTSPDLAEGAHFDSAYTCDSNGGMLGSGANPELDWTGAPSGTKSFVITFIDTTLGADNALGQHWAIWNIPASVMKFPKGTTTLTGDLMAAKQARTYLAPCAQSLMNNMDDVYEFTVYALGTDTLSIQGTSVANCLTALKTAMVLGKATLHGHAGLKGK
jgi:hypothetical protein